MSVGSNDTSQWLSVTEETLFLHDGLMRVTDLVEIPPAVSAALGKLQDAALITFDTKSPSDLADRIKALCGQQNNEYTRLLEYRVSALKGLWRAQQQCVVDDQNSRGATSNNEEAVALLKKQGLLPQGDGSQFSSRLSLLLLFPLLQSQSNLDSALCGTTAELLLACLRECAPLSLMKEPADCLSGLENLLCSWLGENGQQCRARNDAERECLVSAVVALASGRGTVKTILHTVHLLQNMECPLQAVPVGDILRKLLALEGGPGVACAVLGSKHILTWGVEDLLGRDTSAVPGGEIRRSITCDDRFLFVTNGAGKGLAKIGMGLQGTLRGLVYSRNTEIGPGYIAWASGTLLYRPCRFDQYNQMETDDFAQIISPITMEPIGIVKKVDWSMDIMPFVNTVQFCSDGIYFYWLWIAAVVSDRNASPAAVHLDVFKLEASTGVLQQVKPTVTLQKKDEISGKTTNESLLARFRPYRSYAAVAASLTGLGSTVSAASATSREDSSTSCGIAMKTLMKAPIFTDGSLVVVLTPVPGTANQSATRSLFGSGSGLAGLRSLAINMMYSVSEGQFISRTELADAPTCSLARGTTTSSLGVCFDMHNNQIWCCSGDWVDQFFNPSHQAAHHICKQLGLPVGQYRRPDDTCRSSSRCLMHLRGMILSEYAEQLRNPMITNDEAKKHVALLWQILDSNRDSEELSAEVMAACRVINAGLTTFYETEQKRHKLLHHLLTTVLAP
ncbi:PREDICTED: uncharacterized protein LOC106812745 [Priapulus caudatus]|uniref:Uncharacterized protein LOC106812745 n=1 Tax=Priapulus caudatus TaxID=37621 RepID=A0ABM1EJ23_PRICU|nr:PREDICTED: uncharacterized protein LOC106812745 [Priapulus caudatus]